MPAPYSYDLRTKVIKAIDKGMRKTEASPVFQKKRSHKKKSTQENWIILEKKLTDTRKEMKRKEMLNRQLRL